MFVTRTFAVDPLGPVCWGGGASIDQTQQSSDGCFHVKRHPHECQDPRFPSRTLDCNEIIYVNHITVISSFCRHMRCLLHVRSSWARGPSSVFLLEVYSIFFHLLRFFFLSILHVFPHLNWGFNDRGCRSLYRLLIPQRQCDYINTNSFSWHPVCGFNVVADGCIIPPARSWFSPGSPHIWTHQNTSTGTDLGSIQIHLSWPLSTQKSCTSKSVPQGELWHTVKNAYFSSLHRQSRPFGRYLEVMTSGDGWNIDQLVNHQAFSHTSLTV